MAKKKAPKKVTAATKRRKELAIDRVTTVISEALGVTKGKGIRASVYTGRAAAPAQSVNNKYLGMLKTYKPPTRSSDLKEDCDRKHMWARRFGLRLRGDFAPALWTGTIFHKARELSDQGMKWPAIERHLHRMIRECQKEAEDMAAEQKNPLLPNGKLVDKQCEDVFKQGLMGIMMGRVFGAKYAQLNPKYDLLTVEETKDIRLQGLSHLMRIKTDRYLYDKELDGYWFRDYKTTKDPPEDFAPSLQLAVQPRFYRLGLQALRTDRPVLGCVYDVMQKPTIRYGEKVDKGSFDHYVGRCEEWYEEQPHVTFAQIEVRFHEPILSRELALRLHEQARKNTCPVVPWKFPTNENCCKGAFGNSRCQFWTLCASAPVEWAQLIERFYIQESREEQEEREALEEETANAPN